MTIPNDDGYTMAVVVGVGGILVCGAILIWPLTQYMLEEWRKNRLGDRAPKSTQPRLLSTKTR